MNKCLRFFLAAALCCATLPVSGCSSQPTGYTAYAEILDAGGFVRKIVVPMNETVTSLSAADFSVSADLIDRETGETAQVPESDMSVRTAPAAGPLVIARVYPCDKDGTETAKGRYAAIEPLYGPQHPLSGISYYAYGYTRMADCRYSISYQGQLLTDQGNLVVQSVDLISTGRSESGLNLAWTKPQIPNDAPPLIVWLHGAGEGGTDPYVAMIGNRVLNLASPEIQAHFGGAYVLTPQCDTMWMDDGSGNYSTDGSSCWGEALMAAIEEFVEDHPEIDRGRIYLGGCSNGGFMTLRMLMDYPGYFAAAFPVCQAMFSSLISDEELEALAEVPIWFTHAKNDTTVPAKPSTIAIYDRLIEAGAGNAYLSLYENVIDTSGQFFLEDGSPYQYPGHGTWIYVLNDHCRLTIDGQEASLFRWLAQQKR